MADHRLFTGSSPGERGSNLPSRVSPEEADALRERLVAIEEEFNQHLARLPGVVSAQWGSKIVDGVEHLVGSFGAAIPGEHEPPLDVAAEMLLRSELEAANFTTEDRPNGRVEDPVDRF